MLSSRNRRNNRNPNAHLRPRRLPRSPSPCLFSRSPTGSKGTTLPSVVPAAKKANGKKGPEIFIWLVGVQVLLLCQMCLEVRNILLISHYHASKGIRVAVSPGKVEGQPYYLEKAEFRFGNKGREMAYLHKSQQR